MKKLAAVLALVMALAELPSCSFTGLSAQNLMSPPKANADQQAIYRLLQGTQTTDVTFIYPKNGEYRSAIIMRDFTGDGTEDAIGFHMMEDGGVEVQFLTKTGGDEWATAAAYRNTASQVDRVCFGTLPDGGEVVLIGWGSTAGATGRTAAVNAYLYKDEGVVEYPLGQYGEMTVTDFDSDGVNELFTIDKSVPAEVEGEEPTTARARLFGFDRGEPYEITGADGDNGISNYASVVFGRMNASDYGVVVDGNTADGGMTTQVFTLSDGRLVNFPPAVNTEEYTKEFTRPSAASFNARDINGDGYIELPVAIRLPGPIEDTALDSTSYMVEWKALLGQGSRVILRALMNTRETYWFRIPYVLQGRVCAINDVERRTVTYTEVITTESGEELLGGTLFSIRVFTQSAWESRGESSGYTRLETQSDSVYGIQIITRDEQYRRAVQEIARNFTLLSE